MYDSAPGAFRDLALAALIEGDDGSETGDALDDREERLLVRKVLQGRPWGVGRRRTRVRLDGRLHAGARRRLRAARRAIRDEFALEERERFISD